MLHGAASADWFCNVLENLIFKMFWKSQASKEEEDFALSTWDACCMLNVARQFANASGNSFHGLRLRQFWRHAAIGAPRISFVAHVDRLLTSGSCADVRRGMIKIFYNDGALTSLLYTSDAADE